MTASTIFTELLIFLQPNLIVLYIIISCSVLCKSKIVVVKVKVTMKVLNVIEYLRILYLLYHSSLGNHTRCADVQLPPTELHARLLGLFDGQEFNLVIKRCDTGLKFQT